MHPLSESVQISQRAEQLISRQSAEYVERKGIGHPDTICDSIMEAGAVALCRAYREIAGRPLHHNIDKGLLVAGQSRPTFGGGVIEEPIKVILGDRAVREFRGKTFPVGDIVETAAKDWIDNHLRFVDSQQHVVFQNELKPGSPELTTIFERDDIVANDTSAAVGYAPFSETERLVLAAEEFLNSAELKTQFPDAGEDIKVMGVRRDRTLHMTIACAFVDRFIANPAAYFDRKVELQNVLQSHLRGQLLDIQELDLAINTLDDPGRGLDGTFLTVLGTSADGADGGQVGRGNRVNGLITLNRPMTMEAAAGKNSISHVGKIYSVLSHQLAGEIHSVIDVVEEVYVRICSQIGQPLSEPWSVSVDLNLATGVSVADVELPIRELLYKRFHHISTFIQQLSNGDFPVC